MSWFLLQVRRSLYTAFAAPEFTPPHEWSHRWMQCKQIQRTLPPACEWLRLDCRGGRHGPLRGQAWLPDAHHPKNSEIPFGHASTGCTIPKIPGSKEVCDETIAIGFRMPLIPVSRRQASTSRPSFSGTDPRNLAETPCQRTNHVRRTMQNPAAHTKASNTGSKGCMIAGTVECTAVETVSLGDCVNGLLTCL